MYKHERILLVVLFFTINSHSQELKNDVKVNLSSLALKNFSFQYERGITKHIAVALGVRVEPKGAIPLQSTVQSAVKSGDFDFSAMQVGNTAITPEVRFYLGRGRQRGFYIAPYARYTNFNLDIPVIYQSGGGNTEAIFSGHVNSFSGGIMFGMQYTIAKVIILDIWLVGAHYGSSNGSASYTPAQPLSVEDQQSLQQTLDNVNIKPFNFSSSVGATQSTIQTNGPWAGIRALGINLGVRF